MAALEGFSEYPLRGTQGYAKCSDRVENHSIAHGAQGRKIQVRTAAELGHVGQQRGLDSLREGNELFGGFERFGKDRVCAYFPVEPSPAYRVVEACHAP